MMADQSAIAGLREVIASGTEEESMQYVHDHFKEFPEEMQKKIVVGLFTEAAEKSLEERTELAEVKKNLLEVLRKLDKADTR